MKILALDVSTKSTGYCIRDYRGDINPVDPSNDGIIHYGTIKAMDELPVARYRRIDNEVNRIIMDHGLDTIETVVVIERSFVAGGGDTTRFLCELQGVLKLRAYRYGLKIFEPTQTTWRAIFIGSGRADKKAAIEAVTLRGYRPANDDEADAISIALAYGTKMLEAVNRLSNEKTKKKNAKKAAAGAAKAEKKRLAEEAREEKRRIASVAKAMKNLTKKHAA